MSYLANVLMNLAFSIANSRNSGMAIRIKKNNTVEVSFISKEGTKSMVWEDHYPNVGFYLGESANPVRWDFEIEDMADETVISAIDNAVSTTYYKTFMQTEALSRIFNISGPQQDMIVKLLYACLGGIAIVFMMTIAVYGGLPG